MPELVDQHACCRVLELRQYALHPGGRDSLVSLFQEHFLDALEADGVHVPGLFADVDDPDRLVWLRGFTDMASRHQALSDFYLTGDVWRAHSRAANATMVDSDDVLLLTPSYAGADYPTRTVPRLGSDVNVLPGLLVVDVVPRTRLESAGVTPDTLVARVRSVVEQHGAQVLLVALTHPEPNDFTGLPVRDEDVAVWLVRYPDDGARAGARAGLSLTLDDEAVHLRPLVGSQIA
jgi:hypothetical protein